MEAGGRGSDVPPGGTSPPRARDARGLQISWCLYDFANSAFATTILAVLFNEYFARVIAGGMAGSSILGHRIPGPTLYTFVLSLSLVAVAMLAPAVGLLTDRAAHPILWLGALAAPGMAATALLSRAGAGDLLPASLLFLVAMLGFSLSSVVYNALLPRIASPGAMGRLSGWGWGVGYLGGGLVLAIDLALLGGVPLPGGARLKLDVPHSFILTAAWWAAFTIPLLRYGRRLGGARPAPPGAARGMQLGPLLRRAIHSPHLLRFLLADLLYGDGVQTVVAMASIFGGTLLGLPPRSLVLYFLAIQGAAFVGSPLLGRWADRVGDRPALLGCLGVWLAVVLGTWQLGWSGDPVREFWMLGLAGGLVLGPTQSLARSLLARGTPPEAGGAIFSLHAVSNRFSALLGPLTYGIVTWMAGDMRLASLAVGVFFLAGGAILVRVKVPCLERELASFSSGATPPIPSRA